MFEVRIVSVGPGCERAFDDAEWQDAIVLVQAGRVELRGVGGTCRTFARGDQLWLAGVPLRALHNPGREPAVLVALSRANTLPV